MSVLSSFWCGCIRHTAVPLKPDSDCSKSVEHIVGDERKDFDCAALKSKARNHYCAVEKIKPSLAGAAISIISVATNTCLSRQAYLCCNKRRVLWRQTRVCHNKTVVATNIILVAAPANDEKHVDFVLNESMSTLYWMKEDCKYIKQTKLSWHALWMA